MSDKTTAKKAPSEKGEKEVTDPRGFVKLISPFDDGYRVHPVGTVLRCKKGKVYPKSAKEVSEGDYLDYQTSLKDEAELTEAERRELMKKEILAELLAGDQAKIDEAKKLADAAK